MEIGQDQKIGLKFILYKKKNWKCNELADKLDEEMQHDDNKYI